MTDAIRLDEWMQELEKAMSESTDDGFVTVDDLCDAMKRKPPVVREMLRTLKKANRIIIGTVRRENLQGKITTVPAYKLCPAQ